MVRVLRSAAADREAVRQLRAEIQVVIKRDKIVVDVRGDVARRDVVDPNRIHRAQLTGLVDAINTTVELATRGRSKRALGHARIRA